MDDSDRIGSQESLVAIPGHLVFAIEEWLEEQIRQACDDDRGGDETRRAVSDAVHLYEAFVAGSLTPAQTAELADRAADWLQPRWPKGVTEVQEVARLLTATRGLLELRDRALAVAQRSDRMLREERSDQDDAQRVGTSLVAVDPDLVEILRLHTLLVLEANHDPFEEVRDLEPSELLDVASIFRDAMAVLDTIGWVKTEQTEAMDLVMTPGHCAQLRRRRVEIAMTILDRLDSREELTEPEDIAEADQAIRAERLHAHGLQRLLQACAPEA